MRKCFAPFLALFIILMHNKLVQSKRKPDSDIKKSRVVSLFEKDEKEYDRYAAAISAIEPLRAERDQRVRETLHPVLWTWLKVRWGGGTRMFARLMELDSSEPDIRQAQGVCNAYLIKSSRVISSIGLEVSRFNALSQEIRASKQLQRRIMQQAYLYRVASEMDGERFPSIETVDPAVKSSDVLSPQRDTNKVKKQPVEPSKAEKFALALHRIERCRLQQLQSMENQLGTSELPCGFCSPELSPFLSESVKSICSEFQLKAAEIVNTVGLQREEFNKLRKQIKYNPLLRWRVLSSLQKLSR